MLIVGEYSIIEYSNTNTDCVTAIIINSEHPNRSLNPVHFISILISFVISTAFSEPNYVAPTPIPDQYQNVSFVIAASETSYSQAVLKAATLSEQSGILFNTGGVNFDPTHKENNGGLTYSKNECENNGWEYPCYVSRGRWDDGAYITIEYSSAIKGFTPGLYVVIAASGEKKDVVPSLATVKQFVPDAYMKTSSVYVGCMH